jgi:hypothetical protein
MPLLLRPILHLVARLAASLLLLAGSAASAFAAGQCGEVVGAAMRSTEIILTRADFFDADGDEMRTFVDTGSLGMVDAALVSARPRDIVRSFTAIPARSRLSPYFGEDLKGVNVTVSLYRSRIPPVVRIRIRQDCAKYMRNTFLYY